MSFCWYNSTAVVILRVIREIFEQVPLPMDDGSYISMFLEHLHTNDTIVVPNLEIATLVNQHWPSFDGLNTEYHSPEILLDAFCANDDDDVTRTPVNFFEFLMPEYSTWTTTQSCSQCNDRVEEHTNKDPSPKKPYFVIQVCNT